LAEAVVAVLDEAIAAGGSSLRDHAAPDGTLGYFQKGFQVYGQEGNACPACARPVERIVQSGRSSFFCRHCQR
jgi:formamidopyrimidine-DNA glycosylase